MEQAKIRPSVTLYSLDRSLSNLVWLIMSATPTRMLILVEFGWWGIPRKYVKYNHSLTFCSVPFFVYTPGAKTRERICTIDGSKRVKSSKVVPFGGFVKKFSLLPLISPKFRNFCITKAVFAQNTYKSWRKRCQNSIRIRIGNSSGP